MEDPSDKLTVLAMDRCVKPASSNPLLTIGIAERCPTDTSPAAYRKQVADRS